MPSGNISWDPFFEGLIYGLFHQNMKQPMLFLLSEGVVLFREIQ
jgi:hypothetical protein